MAKRVGTTTTVTDASAAAVAAMAAREGISTVDAMAAFTRAMATATANKGKRKGTGAKLAKPALPHTAPANTPDGSYTVAVHVPWNWIEATEMHVDSKGISKTVKVRTGGSYAATPDGLPLVTGIVVSEGPALRNADTPVMRPAYVDIVKGLPMLTKGVRETAMATVGAFVTAWAAALATGETLPAIVDGALTHAASAATGADDDDE